MPVSARPCLSVAAVSLALLAPRAGLAQPAAYPQPAPTSAPPPAPPPVTFETDLPREDAGLLGAGVAVTALGAVALVLGGIVMKAPGMMNVAPSASLPTLLGGYTGVGLGTGLVIAGRDRDYGRPVPRRSLALATVGATMMTVGAGLSAAMNVWPTKDPNLGDMALPEGEETVSQALTLSVGLGGLALFGGGLALLLVGSAQAPQKAGIEVSSARTPALRLSLPTLAVNPLYTERALSRYGVHQGTEVQVGLLRGSF